jgi:hypothetical protein
MASSEGSVVAAVAVVPPCAEAGAAVAAPKKRKIECAKTLYELDDAFEQLKRRHKEKQEGCRLRRKEMASQMTKFWADDFAAETTHPLLALGVTPKVLIKYRAFLLPHLSCAGDLAHFRTQVLAWKARCDERSIPEGRVRQMLLRGPEFLDAVAGAHDDFSKAAEALLGFFDRKLMEELWNGDFNSERPPHPLVLPDLDLKILPKFKAYFLPHLTSANDLALLRRDAQAWLVQCRAKAVPESRMREALVLGADRAQTLPRTSSFAEALTALLELFDRALMEGPAAPIDLDADEP